jgi:hypothetical protein
MLGSNQFQGQVGMTRWVAVLVLSVTAGCAGFPGRVNDADHALCEQARAQARRNDPAAEATLDRIRDLRSYQRCRYELMLRDRGIEPNSI